MDVSARDGRVMAWFGETRRYPIDIDEVPKRLKQTFMATEDARFSEHHGVDYTGAARAIWLIIKTGSKEGVPGGATITPKVARRFLLSSAVTNPRKCAVMLLEIGRARGRGSGCRYASGPAV